MSRPSFDNILTRNPLAVTFLFITLCLLPVMMMRDFSPDNELRYLQIADEAIENGNVFAFTLDGEAYADKPPLYLWIVMLCKLILGKHSMFLLSLFSLIPAFVIISVMDRWSALEKVTDRIAVAFMMMTSGFFLGLSFFLRMDMLMTMFIVLALRSFWLMYTGAGNLRKQSFLLPVWIFLALFTKGPVGLLMPVLAIVCFLLAKRQGKEIGKYLGWKTCGIIAGLCALWFAGVYLDGGKDYLENLLVHQTVGRAVNSFYHKAPFWYYFVAIWYIAVPYTFLVIGALVVSLFQAGDGRQDSELFFAVTVVSTLVMLSVFSSKLAIYLIPVMPFMTLLFVEVLRRTGWKKWMTWALAAPVGLIAVLALAVFLALCFRNSIPSLSRFIEPYSFLNSWTLKLALLLLLSGMVFSLCYLLSKRNPSISLMFVGASMLLAGYTASSAIPKANDWIGYGNLCETIPADAEVATLRVRRPLPMKVYLGRDVSDYQKDFNAFKETEIDGREVSDGPLVLVTRTGKIDSDEGLAAFVENNNHWFVGPYCAVSYNPENINPQQLNELKNYEY
ncbi:MAG: dolichyl-phosphate-mannose--protein mannosyltransferase [Bacteroidales bacterium]|nr:dolichyl-phosphate-mannose--protein mannosyltransferase [Bacteroidales bacterium]